MKKAIRIGDIFNADWLRDQLESIILWKNSVYSGAYGAEARVSLSETMDWALTFGAKLRPLIADTSSRLEAEISKGVEVLFEAQLGALRDVYFGTYPFTSSSCALASFAPVGSGLFGHPIQTVVGVVKAFSTCVGEGPFVTEMDESIAGPLREIALEYGAATGRPRRIGHFDAVASRFGAYVQGATQLALTKLDSLSGRPTLKICDRYLIDGREETSFPLNSALARAKPAYIEMDGWEEDVTGCRKFTDLPPAAQRYVRAIEELVGRPIRYVSVGPERSELMEL